ncbi:unnamed protein product [Auanema sp. JU1783]|nr:unnamed protein product [Auanema sp. JU1783]
MCHRSFSISFFSIFLLCNFRLIISDGKTCRRYSYSNRPSQDCSSCGLTIPPKLFHSVISLNLANNSLNIIDNFPSTYSTLLSLRMDHCSIRIIKPKALAQLQSLKHLDLSHNQLENIQFFRYASSLTTLNLSHNKLRYLPDFSTLTALRLLDLSYNNLLSVSPQHLPMNLESLRLTANYISHLTHWSSLQKLQELDVSFNPLICECSLWKFVTWAEQMALFDSTTLLCRKPTTLRRSSSGEIYCGPAIQDSKEITTNVISIGDPLQLCCIVASSPAPVVFWQHERKNITKGLTTSPLLETGRTRFCLDFDNMQATNYGEYHCIAILGDLRDEKKFCVERDKIPLVVNPTEQLIFYAQFSICVFLGVFCLTCCCCLTRSKTRNKKSKAISTQMEFLDHLDYLGESNDKMNVQEESFERCTRNVNKRWIQLNGWRDKACIHAPLAKFDSEANITMSMNTCV